jgi:hypothetical protein
MAGAEPPASIATQSSRKIRPQTTIIALPVCSDRIDSHWPLPALLATCARLRQMREVQRTREPSYMIAAHARPDLPPPHGGGRLSSIRDSDA